MPSGLKGLTAPKGLAVEVGRVGIGAQISKMFGTDGEREQRQQHKKQRNPPKSVAAGEKSRLPLMGTA